MCRVEGEGSSRLARTRALVSFLAFPVSLEQFRNFFSGIQALIGLNLLSWVVGS